MRYTKDQQTAVEGYWKQAKEFVKRNTDDPDDPPWFDVTRETEKQLEAWESYFRWRLGFLPWGMKMLKNGTINVFPAPCELPEWFDDRFAVRRSA